LAKRALRRSTLLLVLGILVCSGAVFAHACFREVVRCNAMRTAERAGVSVSIASVTLGLGGLSLVDVSVMVPALPGVVAHAARVEVNVTTSFRPTEARLHGVTVTLDGPPGRITDPRAWANAYDAYTAIGAAIERVTLDDGHVIWTGALGDGTVLEADDIVLLLERPCAHGWENVVLASPTVTLETGRGRVGPWAGSVVAREGGVDARLTLDSSGAGAATVAVSAEDGVVQRIDLTVARTNAVELGVSNAVLARRSDDPLFVEGEAHYIRKPEGGYFVGVYVDLDGVRIADAMSPTQARFEIMSTEGEGAAPTSVTGQFGLGRERGTTLGTVTIDSSHVQADVAMSARSSFVCDATFVPLHGRVVWDSRALGRSSLSLVPSSGACRAHPKVF
jgi:hypothetical protein